MKSIYRISIFIMLLATLASCSKEWLDVNHDPNASEQATPELVFPAAQMSVASTIGGTYAIMGGMWSQYFTQSSGSNQYKYIDQFNILYDDFNRQFNELYANGLNDFKFVKEEATKTENWSFVFMTDVMEAYAFQVLVDLYDKIPYTEALQGEANFHPHYDNGQAVYDDLIKKLDEALALDLSAASSKNPGTADYIFGGDMDAWRQFANTLKLKIFLRQVYARPTVAEAGIRALEQNFLGQDAAITAFTESPDKGNPMYEQNIRRLNATDNLKASNTFYSFLHENNDPRIDHLFAPGSGGTIKGLEQGDFNQSGSQSVYSTLIQSPTDPVYFISAAESHFLQAEAILRGWLPGSVADEYNAGVTAAFAEFGLDATDKLMPDSVYAFKADTTMEAQLEQIIVQKWASMAATHGLEAFLEHNRTGYPKISPVPTTDPSYVPGQWTYPVNAITSGQQFPKRLLFPKSERDRNPNTPAEVPITTPVWWDVKP